MRKCGLILIAVALLVTVEMPAARSQTPSGEVSDPKVKLSSLEKKLPDILARLEKDERTSLGDHVSNGYSYYKAKVRLVRRVAPDKAKITLLMEYYFVYTDTKEDGPRRESRFDELVSINLSYCDGVWTTTDIDSTFTDRDTDQYKKKLRWLMLAVDEGGGK